RFRGLTRRRRLGEGGRNAAERTRRPIMTTRKCVACLVLLATAAWLVVGPARSQQPAKPLTEGQIARMVALKVKADVIAGMVQRQGLDFAADDAAVDRLKKAGAPDVVLDAVRRASAPKPAGAAEKPVTYQ